MIAHLYGPRASLDHRAGRCHATLAVPAGTLIDRERDRAMVPGDPAGWISGVGLLLHGRTGLMAVRVDLDYYTDGTAAAASFRRAEEARPKRRHHLPRDLASCPTCGKLVLVARAVEGDEASPATWPVEPSRWIAASINSKGAAAVASPGRLPPRAGEPHRCYQLFGG